MKALGNSESAKEIAKLKKRNSSRSPVQAKVLKYEGKTDIASPEKQYQSPSSSRSKSPGIKNDRTDQFRSPTRSKSPDINNDRTDQFRSPIRSKSPGIKNDRTDQFRSPTQSKSPDITNERTDQFRSPTRSKSPGINNDRTDQFRSPIRSKSPGIKNDRTDQFRSPTRSKSPGITNDRADQFRSPTRSKSPGITNDRTDQFRSPTQSKSPVINNDRTDQFRSPTRSKSPGINNDRADQFRSPTRSKSPGNSSYRPNPSPARSKPLDIKIVSKSKRPNKLFSPTKNKSPDANSEHRSPSRSKSPPIKREYLSRSSSFPSGSPAAGNNERSRWASSKKAWKNESSGVNDDVFDLSWYFDNVNVVTSPDTDEVNENDSGPGSKATESKEPESNEVENKEDESNEAESSERREETETSMSVKGEDRFRNVLNYDIVAWEDATSVEPKKADEFIQRLCDQVRNQVEYMCDMNFISYQAISYKVKIAGAEGILYYIKVNVWENYCVHLRIFSHKNEFKAAVPKLQAILERAVPDSGNIEFF